MVTKYEDLNTTATVSQVDMKRDALSDELHAVLQYAINAGRVADGSRQRANDMQEEANKAETEAVNSWNRFAEMLLKIGREIDGFQQSDLYQKLAPTDTPYKER